jgi:hypothetical protein
MAIKCAIKVAIAFTKDYKSLEIKLIDVYKPIEYLNKYDNLYNI